MSGYIFDLEQEGQEQEQPTPTPTPTPTPAPEEPVLDDLQKGLQVHNQLQAEQTQYNINVLGGTKRDANKQSDIADLSKKYNYPKGFIERHYDTFKERQRKDDLKTIPDTNPNLAKWIKDSDRVAIVQDDIENLKEVDTVAGRFRVDLDMDPTLWDLTKRGAESNAMNMDRSLVYMMMMFGGRDVDEGAAEASKKFEEFLAFKEKDPEHVKKYQAGIQKANADLSKSWTELWNIAEEDWEGQTWSKFKDFIAKDVEMTGDLWAKVGAWVDDPKAMYYQSMESALHSLSAIPTMLAGAGIGSMIAPGVGTLVGAGTAGFIHGAILEFSMEFEGTLQDQGVDIRDPKAIAKAFRDPDIMKEAKAAAARKGITTAAVDTFLTMWGARGVTKAVGPLAKTKAAAKAMLVKEPAAEAVSEGAGQLAKHKGDITKVSADEMVAEFFGAIFLGGGMQTGVYALSAPAKAKRLVKGVKNTAQKTMEAKEFEATLDTLQEVAQNTKLSERDKASLSDMIQTSSQDSAVFFQADEFEDHWANAGEDVNEKADELLPGGRADLDKAKQTGAPLRIPMGDYITKVADEETFAALHRIARKNPEAITGAQAETLSANIKPLFQQIQKEIKSEMRKSQEVRSLRKEVREDYVRQIQEAEGISVKEAKAKAAVAEAGLNALGDILGIDSYDMLKKRGLEVRHGELVPVVSKTVADKVDRLVKERDTALEVLEETDPKYAEVQEEFDSQIRTLEEGEGKTLFQKDVIDKINQDSLGFYSKLENEVEKMDFKAMPAKDLANRINKLGLKKEEIEYSGILELLESTEGKISKEDVMIFIREGGLQFKEITFGGEGDPLIDVGESVWGVYNQDGEWWGSFSTEEAAEEKMRELNEEGPEEYEIQHEEYTGQTLEDMPSMLSDPTRYSKYTMPGGENYREVLLTLPGKKETPLQLAKRLYGEEVGSIYDLPKDKQKEVEKLIHGEARNVYSSSHWDESNVLVHYRLNDRTDAEGNSILFIEEIQSDWHQEGRKKGYIPKDREKAVEEVKARRKPLKDKAVKAFEALSDKVGAENVHLLQEFALLEDGREGVKTRLLELGTVTEEELDNFLTAQEEHSKAITEEERLLRKDFEAIPQAPFKATDAWMELAFKRILRMAAEQGYDKVAWTPGSVQSERYDLSRQIDEIKYYKQPDGTYVLDAYKDNRNVMAKEGLNIEDVEEHVGKELAKKIEANEGSEMVSADWRPNSQGKWAYFSGVTQVSGAFAENTEENRKTALSTMAGKYKRPGKSLTGIDLKTEAKGMIDLYDKMLPRIVNKYAGKLDKKAKTEVTNIQLEEYQVPKQTYSEESKAKLADIAEEIRVLRKDKSVAYGKIDRKRKEYKREEKLALTEKINAKLEERNKADNQEDEIRLQEELEALYQEREDLLKDAPSAVGDKDIERLNSKIVKLREEQMAIKPESVEEFRTEDALSLPITDKLRDKVTKGQPLFQKDEGKPRGFIDLSDPEKMVINILEGANKSTMLHEMGHAFLEYMKIVDAEISTLPELNDKQRQFKKDIDTLLTEFGLDSLEEITTEHHEKFARLTEAYFMEGKAPSKELRSVFNTFKTWLVGIYKNLVGLERAGGMKLDLSSEMKEVFNRLFATQEEIAEANSTMGYDLDELLIATEALSIAQEDRDRIIEAHEEAKQDAELELYRKHLKQLKKKRTKEYKDRKKDIKKQKTIMANGMPLYKAIDAIKTGKVEDQAIPGYETVKMNTEILKQYLSSEEMRSFPRSLYSADGVDPAITADVVGYGSAHELITEIKHNPNKQQFIETQTQMELDREFPDFMAPAKEEEVKVQAINEVHNTAREKALQLEMDILWDKSPAKVKSLIRQVAKRKPTTKDMRAQAESFINETLIKELRPYDFQLSENRYRKKAMATLLKGDFEKAAEAKIKETFNHHLYKKASEAQDSIDKRIKKSRDKLRKSNKDLAKKGDIDIFKAAQSIMAQFGMLPETQVGRLQEYLEKMKSYSPQAYAKVEGLASSLINVGPVNYKELTYEEFSDVMDVVEALQQLAHTENTILVEGKRIPKTEAIDMLLTQLNKRDERSLRKLDTPWKKFKAKVSALHAVMTRTEHLINNLDGADPKGVWRKIVWSLANNAQNEYELTQVKYAEKLNQIIKDYFEGIQIEKEFVNLNQYFSGLPADMQTLSKMELVMSLVHSGNDSNLRKLLIGRNWGYENMDGTLNRTAYDNMIQDLATKGLIDKKMMDGVQAIWDLFEEIKPEIQQAHKDVYGYYFKEIEAAPVKMPWGDYRGGYAPAVTDPLLVEAEAVRQNEASTEAALNQFTFAQAPKGFTKERVEAYARALSLDFKLIPAHVEKAVRFAKIEPALHDLNKVFNDQRMSNALFEINQFWNKDVFKPWLARFATQSTSQPATMEGIRDLQKMGSFLRRNANMAIMMGNVRNTFENMSDFSALYAVVDKEYIHQGLKQYWGNRKETSEFVTDSSKYMKLRMEHQLFEVRDTYNELMIEEEKGIKGKYRKATAAATKHTYALQMMVQSVADVAAWMGAYNEAVGKHKMEHGKAVEHADSIIRRMMGDNRPIDLAGIEAQGQMAKILLTFYSFFLNKANLVYHAGKGNKAKVFWLGMIIPNILAGIFRRAASGFDEDRDEEYMDDMLDVIFITPLQSVVASYPGGSTAFRLVEGQFTDQQFDDRLSVSPLVGMIEGVSGISRMMTREEIRSRDLRDALNFITTVTGIPVSLAGRPIGFMIDMEQGKQKAENPLDYTRGILTGRSGKK